MNKFYNNKKKFIKDNKITNRTFLKSNFYKFFKKARNFSKFNITYNYFVYPF